MGVHDGAKYAETASFANGVLAHATEMEDA